MMELLDPSLLQGEGSPLVNKREKKNVPAGGPRFADSGSAPLPCLRRWLLPDQCVWSHVPHQELPGGSGSQGVEL